MVFHPHPLPPDPFRGRDGTLALRSGKTDPLATFLGKASIFALMVLYVMKVAGLLGVPWIGDDVVIRIVEYVVALSSSHRSSTRRSSSGASSPRRHADRQDPLGPRPGLSAARS